MDRLRAERARLLTRPFYDGDRVAQAEAEFADMGRRLKKTEADNASLRHQLSVLMGFISIVLPLLVSCKRIYTSIVSVFQLAFAGMIKTLAGCAFDTSRYADVANNMPTLSFTDDDLATLCELAAGLRINLNSHINLTGNEWLCGPSQKIAVAIDELVALSRAPIHLAYPTEPVLDGSADYRSLPAIYDEEEQEEDFLPYPTFDVGGGYTDLAGIALDGGAYFAPLDDDAPVENGPAFDASALVLVPPPPSLRKQGYRVKSDPKEADVDDEYYWSLGDFCIDKKTQQEYKWDPQTKQYIPYDDDEWSGGDDDDDNGGDNGQGSGANAIPVAPRAR